MEKKLFDILKERGYIKDLTHEKEIINTKELKNGYIRSIINGWRSCTFPLRNAHNG